MFRPIIFRMGLRYINRRFLQSALLILGVALGVAVVIAIDIANGSAGRAFNLTAQSITGSATHQITGGPAGLDSDIYRELRLDLGLRNSAPVVAESVRAIEFGDQVLRLLGVDPFAEPPFRDYLNEIEVLGETDGGAFDALNNFIAEPGTALISQTLADQYGVSAGDTITISPGTERIPVRIIGLLIPGDNVSKEALDDLVLTDIATAQEVTGQPGRLTRIDLILAEDYDTSIITDVLPAGASLIAVEDSSGALDQMTEAFEINLQALSLLAVVVGVFLIYNTVTFSVVQRRPVIGILRSLGATKRQVFALIIGEAFVLGVIGTVLGMGLGVIFGRVMVTLVTRTISDLYFALNVTSVTVDPLSLIKGAAIGIAVSVGAAVVPSIDATRTPPAGTMRRSQFEERTRKLLPYITATAVALCFAGWGLLQIPTTSLIVSFAALFCVIVGGALFTPLLLVAGMRFFTPITGRLFGVLGRMAPRAVSRSLSRTAVAVAALTIAVSVIVGVSVMISSFRGTVANWLDTTLGADIFISPPLLTANSSTVDVDPAIRDQIALVDGVEAVSASRSVSAIAPDYPDMLPANLIAVDFDIARGAREFVWNNAPGGDSMAAQENGQVMVSEPFAFRRGITQENNTITLLTDAGEQTFEVFAVYYDYSTDQGTIHMGRTTYDQYFDDPFITSMGVFVEPDADIDVVMQRIRDDVATGTDLIIQSNRALRQSVFEVFDRTFTITVALRLLAALVAFIGILSALMALQLEHTREYGVMRSTGMTGRQLWAYTLTQTGLMGTVAGVLALPVGLVLAVVLIYVINVRSFGWTMQFMIMPNEVLQAFTVAIGASLLAGLYPAWKITRLAPARALRSE